jgi:lipoprotein-anchoring transpeptidase ErfK/SrfK
MRNEKRSKVARAAAVILMAAAEAFAEEQMSQAGAPAAVRRIVVSIPDRKLALLENGRVVKTYSTAVGATATPTPAGEFQIVNKLVNPTWYHPGKVVPPGKSNPLGARWIGLSQPGFGIHGTNAPKSIGQAASHGCIRMAAADIKELFDLVRVGDAVEFHGERDAVVARLFEAPETSETLLASATGGE